MEKRNIIFFGAGGHASKIIEIVRQKKEFNIVGYISTEKKGTVINDYPVLGSIDEYNNSESLKKKYYHIAIGDNSVRYRIYEAIGSNADNMVTLISCSSQISPGVPIGIGTAITHGAVILNKAKIGFCSLVDTGAIIDHDTEIGDFVNIAPGSVICGGVKIGFGAVIGAGATIIEKISIGENVLIGAGSVVVKDIEPNVLARGNPAKIIKKRTFMNAYLK